VPYALPLAVTVGLLDLIPLVGAILGATLCAFVALSVGWPAAVILVVYFVVYQQLENHFLAPVIYSRTVAMSPLTVLLVSLAGAVLGGLVGVLIAIPLASAGSIAVGELLRSKGVEGLADLAEVITEGAPEEGPVPRAPPAGCSAPTFSAPMPRRSSTCSRSRCGRASRRIRWRRASGPIRRAVQTSAALCDARSSPTATTLSWKPPRRHAAHVAARRRHGAEMHARGLPRTRSQVLASCRVGATGVG